MADDPDNFKNLGHGIRLILEKMARLEASLDRHAEQAAEDRKEAAEDRKQAAEDRKAGAERENGIRKALIVIGRRGGEFVEIQKGQAAQLKKLAEISEKNTAILEKNTQILQAIHKTLRSGQNGKPGNGKGLP